LRKALEKKGNLYYFLCGEKDHKIPVHDQTLRQTGAFRAKGRIIGHSVLHGGPFLYGISPAVKHYWTISSSKADDVVAETIPIILEDIPDIDLRCYISQVIDMVNILPTFY
jgi:hypothetical protein